MNFKEFVRRALTERCFATFISNDEEVEIGSSPEKELVHFEFHTADERSGLYTMDRVDEDEIEKMDQDMCGCSGELVEGYIR